MTKKMLAACGLDCAQCPAYIALQTNDNDLRIKTAIDWTAKYGHPFRPEDINCVGCLQREGIHLGHCGICSLRLCALEKNISNCNICPDFATCKKRQDFEQQTGMSIKTNFSSGDE